MDLITVTTSHARGFLPGTSKWLVKELQERKAYLEVGVTKFNKPACFLKWTEVIDGKEEKKSLALAKFYSPEDWGSPKIHTYPFPEDKWQNQEPEIFFGALLTEAAEKLLYDIADKAGDLLRKEMESQDTLSEEEVVTVNVLVV